MIRKILVATLLSFVLAACSSASSCGSDENALGGYTHLQFYMDAWNQAFSMMDETDADSLARTTLPALDEIKETLEDAKLPRCFNIARTYAVQYMQFTIDGYVLSIADNVEQAEVDRLFDFADENLRKYFAELERVYPAGSE